MDSRRAWFFAVAALLLVVLSVGGYAMYARAWVGEGPTAMVFGRWWPWRQEIRLTATPTKTPAAVPSATSTPTPLLRLPTLTPSATPTDRPVDPARDQQPPTPPLPTSTPIPPLPTEVVLLAERNGIDPTGRFVIVDQNQQQMHILQDGILLRTLPVSSGNPDNYFRTPAWSGVIGEYWGSFNARGAWADDAWYLFELMGGGTILIHSAPYVLEDGVKIYQELDALGLYPASRGCIRLVPDDAQWFSDWQPQGVPIVITAWDGGTAQEG